MLNRSSNNASVDNTYRPMLNTGTEGSNFIKQLIKDFWQLKILTSCCLFRALFCLQLFDAIFWSINEYVKDKDVVQSFTIGISLTVDIAELLAARHCVLSLESLLLQIRNSSEVKYDMLQKSFAQKLKVFSFLLFIMMIPFILISIMTAKTTGGAERLGILAKIYAIITSK